MDNTKFYESTHDWLNIEDDNNQSNDFYKQRVEEIISNIGYIPTNALELGSGQGIDAFALGEKGVQVDALELVASLSDFAKEHHAHPNVRFHTTDFFDYETEKKYNLVYYFDGFGVTNDEGQTAILKRIKGWLEKDGHAYIDIYNPAYWKKAAGQTMNIGKQIKRQYDFKHQTNRFTDTWTNMATGETETQSLRCYSVEEFTSLCQNVGLEILKMIPGGSYDYEQKVYSPKVALENCMMYTVVLK